MNDEPSSSASTARNDTQDGPAIPSTAAEVAERRKKNRENFNRRRGDLLDDLLKNLDILVYAELSTIYYMDCQFLLFLLRSLLQLLYLTPKPAHFPEAPRNSSYLAAIFGSNLLCVFLHILRDAPSAGESTRGYLHGSVAMDFIGQKGPSSRFKLVLLDVLVLGLQIVHVATLVMRQKLRATPGMVIPVAGITDAPAVSVGQDLDLEERGVRRSAEVQRQGDIEMATLNPSGPAEGAAGSSADNEPSTSSERETLLATTAALERTDAHIFDAFNSGQIVLADLDLPKSLREVLLAQMKVEPEDAARAESNRRMRERVMGRFWRGEFGA